MTSTDLISTTEARDILGLKERSSVRRMVERGALTPIYSGRVLLFNRADVERLANERNTR